MRHDDPLIIKHPDTGFISVSGDDACAFLQSIITTNVATIAVSTCRPSALLTPQGRVLIDMMVYRPAINRFILRCDSTRRDDLFTRLRRYRLRRPIEIVTEPDIRLYLLITNKTANQSEKKAAGQIHATQILARTFLPMVPTLPYQWIKLIFGTRPASQQAFPKAQLT